MKGFAAGSDSFYFQRKASHFTLLWEMCVTVSCCCYLREVSITCSSQLLVCTLYCPVLSSRSGTGFEACTAQFFCGIYQPVYWFELCTEVFISHEYILAWTVLPSFCGTDCLISHSTGVDSLLSHFRRTDTSVSQRHGFELCTAQFLLHSPALCKTDIY